MAKRGKPPGSKVPAYKVGDKGATGQTIASIHGISGTATVYTTTDNQLRWEYFKNGGKLSKKARSAVNHFDALTPRIAQLPIARKEKLPIYYLLARALFSALDSGVSEPLASYFRPVERMIAAAKKMPGSARNKIKGRKVFIVHGRDEAAKEAMARFLSTLQLKPIILHEQPNLGKTIIEKFESQTDVAYAVVLLTPDDKGGLNESAAEMKARARQNVIFELGFFFGSIGRNRVAALHKGDLELPSDYQGIVFIKMDEAAAWKMVLAQNMRAVGLKIDLNLLIPDSK